MNIDERLEALAQSVELLASMHKDTEQGMNQLQQRMNQLQDVVEKHERWQQKVERSLVAGIEAALREWRNGE